MYICKYIYVAVVTNYNRLSNVKLHKLILTVLEVRRSKWVLLG